MRKLFFSVFAVTLLLFAVPADVLAQTGVVAANVPQEKVAVKPEDLPEAIKTTLSGDTYAGWQVTSAFLITKEDKSQFFEISMTKGEETSKIKLDKDGKKVE